MSGPPPPRRARPPQHARHADMEDDASSYEPMSPAGAGYNVPRRGNDPYDSSDMLDGGPDTAIPPPSKKKNILSLVPDTTLGENVHMKGELTFDKLLRIDGSFHGRLISEGSLIVGRKGSLIGDVLGMDELMIDGKIIGNVSCERAILRGSAQLYGNMTAKSLSLDPTVVIVGSVNVSPDAPDVPEDVPNRSVVIRNIGQTTFQEPEQVAVGKKSFHEPTKPSIGKGGAAEKAAVAAEAAKTEKDAPENAESDEDESAEKAPEQPAAPAATAAKTKKSFLNKKAAEVVTPAAPPDDDETSVKSNASKKKDKKGKK